MPYNETHQLTGGVMGFGDKLEGTGRKRSSPIEGLLKELASLPEYAAYASAAKALEQLNQQYFDPSHPSSEAPYHAYEQDNTALTKKLELAGKALLAKIPASYEMNADLQTAVLSTIADRATSDKSVAG